MKMTQHVSSERVRLAVGIDAWAYEHGEEIVPTLTTLASKRDQKSEAERLNWEDHWEVVARADLPWATPELDNYNAVIRTPDHHRRPGRAWRYYMALVH